MCVTITMEKSRKQRHLYFMRVSENCQLLTELYVVPHEANPNENWFEDRHLQEVIILLRDPIKAKVVSYYEQNKRKKWSSVKEANESKKKPIQDEHQITTGQSVKIGYKFVDSNLFHHSCLMPAKMGAPVWKDNHEKHAGGGFSNARLFPKKLVVFVCSYHPATVGQTTSQLMRSLCATPPSKNIAISSYFARKADNDFVSSLVTDSACRKKNRLKKIVKGKQEATGAGTAESSENRDELAGGGFLPKHSGETDPETADGPKTEAMPSPSESEMDCNSDGVPDAEEINGRLCGDYRSDEIKEHISWGHCGPSSSNLPVSPEKGIAPISLLAESNEVEESSAECYVSKHSLGKPYRQRDISKTATDKLRSQNHVSIPAADNLENMHNSSARDAHKGSNVSSPDGLSPRPLYERCVKNAQRSEVTVQSLSISKESELSVASSEINQSSPSSSGDFDQRRPKKVNARGRSKLSLKRSEAKKGSANKVKSSPEMVSSKKVRKTSSEDVIKDRKACVDEEMELKKQTKNFDEALVKGVVMEKDSGLSDFMDHPTINCSVVLEDITKCLPGSTVSMKSPQTRIISNHNGVISSPEKKAKSSASSDDELMSASFLYTEKTREQPEKDGKTLRHHSPMRTVNVGEKRWNGLGGKRSVSNAGQVENSSHPSIESVENDEDGENLKHKRQKQSRLALKKFSRVIEVPKLKPCREQKGEQSKQLQRLMDDLDWDSDSQGQSDGASKMKSDDEQAGYDDEPMEVEDLSSKASSVRMPDQAGPSSSTHCETDRDRHTLRPDTTNQGDLVHISDDSCDGYPGQAKHGGEDDGRVPAGGSQGSLGVLDDEVIDLSQGNEDEESDSWFDNIFGNVRLVTDLKVSDIVYLTQRNKSYLHGIFQGKRACERHQCYKKKGPTRIGMAGNVRLGPFKEEQMDAVMGELVKVYCAKHFKYMDYLSKVLLPEAMNKIYMDVHGVSHSQAEEVMRGVQKEHPRTT